MTETPNPDPTVEADLQKLPQPAQRLARHWLSGDHYIADRHTRDPLEELAVEAAGVLAPPELLTAAQALMELKRRVTVITKDGTNTTPGANYKFRGIDQVMDTCGPIERKLGLLCLPDLISTSSEQVEYGAKRTLGFRTHVQVAYRFLGPDGSEQVIGTFPGEAMDSGDKGTAKAMSVALRTMYLQVLTVPTGEPDPDQSTYEVSKPEAITSDPVTMAKLREKIAKADTDPRLRKAYEDVVAEHEGEKATITLEDRNLLTDEVAARKAAMDAAAAAEQVQVAPEDTGANP